MREPLEDLLRNVTPRLVHLKDNWGVCEGFIWGKLWMRCRNTNYFMSEVMLVQGWRYVSETYTGAFWDFDVNKPRRHWDFQNLSLQNKQFLIILLLQHRDTMSFLQELLLTKSVNFLFQNLELKLKFAYQKIFTPILQTRCHNMPMYYETALYFWKSVTIAHLWTCIQAGPPGHFALTAAMTHFNGIFSRCAFVHIIW